MRGLVSSATTMKLLQFAVAELSIIICIRVEIVELAEIHIFGAGDGAITIAIHQPEPLGLAQLHSFCAALTLASIAAHGAGAKSNRLEFFQSKPAITIAIERVECRFMPLLKFGSINAAVTIPIKYPQPILSTEIDRITVSYAVPVRSVEPVTVTQPVLIGRVKPVTGPVLQQVT